MATASSIVPPRLLQRDAELRTLDAALTGARAGAGRVVLVEGTAGVGRSVLLDHAAARAHEHELRVLGAAGDPAAADVAFGLARRLLAAPVAACEPARRARLFAGAAAPAAAVFGGDPSTAPPETVHALHRLLERLAADGPLAVVVDDVQWADEASLLTLGYLARRVAAAPVALVLGVRSGEPGATAAVVELVADAAATVLRPRPLDADAVAVLVQDRLGDAAAPRTFSLTAGNPLLLSALVDAPAPAAGADDEPPVPAVLVGWARRRLDALGAEPYAFASALAVLGAGRPAPARGVPVDLVAALAELDADGARQALDVLRERGLAEGGRSAAFAQPLLAAAVRQALPGHRRAVMHGRAAELLRRRGAAADAVADQLLAALPTEDGWPAAVLVAAAERAVVAGDWPRAAACLGRALDEPLAPARRARLRARLGELSAPAATAAPDVAAAGSRSRATAGLGRAPAAAGARPAEEPDGAGTDQIAPLARLDRDIVALRRAGNAAAVRARRGERVAHGLGAGRIDEAVADAEAALTADAAGAPWFGPAALALVTCQLERGEAATARAVHAELTRRAGDAPGPASALELAATRIALVLDHGLRPARAAAAWAGLAPDGPSPSRRRPLDPADRPPRQSEARADQPDPATDAPLDRAWAQLEAAGPALGADGRERLREAIAIADDCGATVLAQLAREALVRAGGRPARAARPGPRVLSVAERGLVALAARGLDEAAIAERCVLDAATVAAQLRRVRHKLGLPPDADLATAAV